jgi:O-acetyl-ADP-ribose deacetylase (regulator of RNase III)
MPGRIIIVLEDITSQRVDSIVNAANSSLLGGGGVDGAIHRAAGPQLLEACRKLGGCPTGEARITPGFRLPAPWVIHTVGPVWHGGEHAEDALLAACYRNTLLLAAQYGLRTLAFPNISTGAYGFPLRRAAAIAIEEIRAGLRQNTELHEVRCVCFDIESQAVLRDALAHANPE